MGEAEEQVGVLPWVDATGLAEALQRGDISAEACVEHYLARIARFNPSLNAIVVSNGDAARQRAREADEARARGATLGPLHGVPLTLKESFDLAGHPTTFGNPMFADNIASDDSQVASALQKGGGIVLGKTNVPIGLTDFQTYNAIYGTTRNPWDLERSPGGSSGGEAAAVSAGLCALGFGSDIGSSIRNPSHYCGLFGHKPTYGIIPNRGHNPVPHVTSVDLAVAGPIARSARDLRLALDVTSGPRPDLPGAWQLALPPLTKELSDLRVALWASDPCCPVETEVAARCERVAEALATHGARVDADARPDLDIAKAHRTYVKLLGGALAEAEPESTFEAKKARIRELPKDATSEQARAAWNGVLPHREWLKANERRTRARLAFRDFFAQYDVIICPVAPTPAMPHDHSPMRERKQTVAGAPRPYFEMLFWAGLATAHYLPSTVIPTGASAGGLPIGVQLVGAEGHDLWTIGIAERLEAEGYTFQPPPGY